MYECNEWPPLQARLPLYIATSFLAQQIPLVARIRKAYADEQPAFEGITNNATDTLVTKILLGSLGCVPAYGRYYVKLIFFHSIINDGIKAYIPHCTLIEYSFRRCFVILTMGLWVMIP
mgnify:CR=1 FL=1